VGVLSPAYVLTLGLTVLGAGTLTFASRHWPGAWTGWARRLLALVLLGISSAWVATNSGGHWSPATSLPLALCDIATLVAAAALWWEVPILVELTYFWGLAGSLQSLLTPDLRVGFPSMEFFEYVVGHSAIVTAAAFLVFGLRHYPRSWAVPRCLGITAAYTALVGGVDALTGGDYMYLRRPPASWTLLRLLGPWPWYVLSAAAVAAVLLAALDSPFWRLRRRAASHQPTVRTA
jgi:hypothetical integral membrane protein (TIGR02206 family)